MEINKMLLPEELKALDLTKELANLVKFDVGVEGYDLREIYGHIHAIQRAIMSQAAGRAYPERFRLLQGTNDDGN